MRRRFLSILLTICMLASIFPTGAWAAKDLAEEIEVYSEAEHNAMAVEAYKLTVYDLDGSGTEKDPYKISTREDLETLADAVNAGNDLKGVYFKQTVDINLGGKDDPWTVIGYVKGNTPHPFNGVYDGDNFMIYGLFVGTTDEDGEPVGTQNEDAGLFGHVGINGVIRKVHVVDCIVYNKALYVGGIAGRNEGLVEYCSSNASDPDASSGVVNGSWQYAGGIVGYNFGTISYCYSNCDVLGAQKIGGITGGQNGGAVANCYFRGYVYADDI
ncbi:MAG: hypothetical protein J1F22_09255, partial [Lachnospiraceae bacterium]|nr:hypothetical protein [Lachnospiraceae bacterium]